MKKRNRHSLTRNNSDPAEPNGRRDVSDDRSSRRGYMKVLIVEDEPLIRLGLASLVEEAGFIALDVPNADAAVEVLEDQSEIAVLVTDVDMPGSMDGIALARVVRDRWPQIRIIAISGKVGVNAMTLPPGARFFAKPVREDALIAAISRPRSSGPSP